MCGAGGHLRVWLPGRLRFLPAVAAAGRGAASAPVCLALPLVCPAPRLLPASSAGSRPLLKRSPPPPHSASSFTYAACSIVEALPSSRHTCKAGLPVGSSSLLTKAMCPCGRTRCLACPGGTASGRTLTSRCGQAHAAYIVEKLRATTSVQDQLIGTHAALPAYILSKQRSQNTHDAQPSLPCPPCPL